MENARGKKNKWIAACFAAVGGKARSNPFILPDLEYLKAYSCYHLQIP
jgi:hypothetical protein